MQGELMPYVRSEQVVPKRDRRIARPAKDVYDETRLAGFRVSSGVALAGHAMEEIAGLDARRHWLAGNDPALGMALLDIEIEAIQGAKAIIRHYNDPWGF
jgi:hypothetical protein